MSFRRLFALSCLAVLVAGCEGGYDGWYVSVRYPSDALNLYNVTIVRPLLSGFDGQDPRCDQSGGVVPTGMTINNDCTITGVPTRAGSFDFSYRVRAENTVGEYDDRDTLTVRGPTVTYATHPSAAPLNSTVQDVPQIGNWTAPTDGTVLTWSYRVVGGSLPPGLTLDAATGIVSGQVTSTGTYTTNIQATLTTVYGSYNAPVSVYQLQVV